MLEEEYDDEASIPAQYRHLYVVSGDKFALVSAGAFKTVDDVTRVQEALRKEREDHKESKRKLNAFNGLDPEDVHSKLDRFDELELSAKGNMDEEKINTIVQSRIKSVTAPLERQIASLTNENGELKDSNNAFKAEKISNSIRDNLRTAASEAKVVGSAVNDVLDIGERLFTIDEGGRIVTRDNVGVTPGVEASVWLSDVKQSRAHWWPESQGAGARGGNGKGFSNNPFSKDGWNMTEQGKMVRENPDLATQYAKSAGTSVGGPRPK